ncbi:MAG TPA: NADH dehydrogenase (quinone) subunit G [Chloroflexi bacterium]|nr:NADH dehydrogenase (quinone) subunit G [Chloroflexota bacterium]|tara:strand:- start:835 stop:3366 length:2532 start_codon:yes stop_codon:yes gene_type:complete
MDKNVILNIDDNQVSVPSGTLVVDAAKQIGNDIPVFCYHPKLDPVGMCRMCLVEVGTPLRDNDSGEVVLDKNSKPTINWMPNLQTACTMVVSEGMCVRTVTDQVSRARKDVVEFLLTSHPLDCPVCDKGGECPLQNLTMRHGSSESRFLLEEKMNIAKHVPLGDLIYLDRERCIQCARCTRFQEELVGDAVIGFEQRGRALQIVTYSDPGFDSHFSGNTTDICPVGALTTADFRFGARPWELTNTPSLCTNCAVGCNIHISTRRSGVDGEWQIKRIMPRQNEQVNEIWICDKARFGHHYVSSKDRLDHPLIRKHGELVETTWEHALTVVANNVKQAKGSIVGLAGERLTNEDLFSFSSLVEGSGGRLFQWPGLLGGGDIVNQVGVGTNTDLAKLSEDTAVLVIASDLAEEAPMWWFKIRQSATKLGASINKSKASVIVANARPTKADDMAKATIRYRYGDEVRTVLALTHYITNGKQGLIEDIAANDNTDLVDAANIIAQAKNLIVFYGGEGLQYESSNALAQACANMLIAKGSIGKKNNGLIPVWPNCNTQGAWDMGVKPSGVGTEEFLSKSDLIFIAGADPVDDGENLPKDVFVVVNELFQTETAMNADVVLPVQSFAEREGSYTSGDRRVQRFYPALPCTKNVLPDWEIFQKIGNLLGICEVDIGPSVIMDKISEKILSYQDINYKSLSEFTKQWPDIGGQDSYYGGTGFENTVGIGVQTKTLAELGDDIEFSTVNPLGWTSGDLLGVPITLSYDRGSLFYRSEIMHSRVPEPYVKLSKVDAGRLDIVDGDQVSVVVGSIESSCIVNVSDNIPSGFVLIPRSMGIIMNKHIVPINIKKCD